MLFEEEPCQRHEEGTIRVPGRGRAHCYRDRQTDRPGRPRPRCPSGHLGNWVKKERLDRAEDGQLDEDSLAELLRLRKEVAELRTGA